MRIIHRSRSTIDRYLIIICTIAQHDRADLAIDRAQHIHRSRRHQIAKLQWVVVVEKILNPTHFSSLSVKLWDDPWAYLAIIILYQVPTRCEKKCCIAMSLW